MSLLIHLIIVLLVMGLLLYCIRLIPGLPAPVLAVAQIIVILVCAVWLLNYSGALSGVGL